MFGTQKRDLGWRKKCRNQATMEVPEECSEKGEPRMGPREKQALRHSQVRSRGGRRGSEMGARPRGGITATKRRECCEKERRQPHEMLLRC